MHTDDAPTQSANNSITSAGGRQFLRLKVEDALSYLNQVKYKFNDQPQVYNYFLDVMQKFKLASLDPPEVIRKVSHLFRGHPELIVDFNTFLPPGYKIEVQTNEQGYAFQVSVSMQNESPTLPIPLSSNNSGITTTKMVETAKNFIDKIKERFEDQPDKYNEFLDILQTYQKQQQNVKESEPTSLESRRVLRSSEKILTPEKVHSQLTKLFENHDDLLEHLEKFQFLRAQDVSQIENQAKDRVSNSVPSTLQCFPDEFNHAINFVNKIKNRFQDRPDKYKKFLEILHIYYKQQQELKKSFGSERVLRKSKKIHIEEKVHRQVAELFHNQPDLLEDFERFLPDTWCPQKEIPKNVPCEYEKTNKRKRSRR